MEQIITRANKRTRDLLEPLGRSYFEFRILAQAVFYIIYSH